jgi:hypothetical protein
MASRMQLQKRLLSIVKAVLTALIMLPMVTYAHVISIAATTPFPTEVPATTSATATFIITNISKANITAIDRSRYPAGSGLSTSASTCGSLLSPGQTCTMQVTIQAPSSEKTISSALQVWGKPTVDGVQYPFSIQVTAGLPAITLEEMPVNGLLPALRDPVVAHNNGNWLIVSGSSGNFHQFENTFFLTSIYVYNPATTQLVSMSVAATNLPSAVKAQLASANTEFVEDGDTLYIIGGFNTVNNINFTTLQTITAINVPGMINAIQTNNTNLAAFVSTTSGPAQFKVTGGQVAKIGNAFYLAFGQECFGDNYCSGPGSGQIYTNSIYQFATDPSLSSISIINTVTHGDTDNSGWRRRDYTLSPFMTGTTQTILALGGPFTQDSNPLPGEVWTNTINFDGNIQANGNFLNQQANQYFAPNLSMYSSSGNKSYIATFSGLSNLYWGASGLVNDTSTPYGNILDLIAYNGATGAVQEYANTAPLCSGQPVASCLYMGLAGIFIPTDNATYFDSRHILQLDQLPKKVKTLVGYVYAGMLSPDQDIFTSTPPPNGPSYTTNRIYAVYLVPSGSGSVTWKNITNLYPGIPHTLRRKA